MSDNPICNDYGHPARALLLTHTLYGPVIYVALGKTMVDQLRSCASLLTKWAEKGCAKTATVWVKPTARSAWEPA
jgi:hypothetical protein